MRKWAADFASRIVHPPPSLHLPPVELTGRRLADAGYVGVLRYILGDGKGITDAEYADLTHTPSFALALIMETGPQAAQGGFEVGRTEATAAFHRADQLGWPSTAPIYFVGEDPQSVPSSEWGAIEAYFRGVLSVVPVSRVGDYGSAAQISHIMHLGLATYGWAVETWPGDPGGCHIRQMVNPVQGAPDNFWGGVDRDAILKPAWGQWSALGGVAEAEFRFPSDIDEEHMIVTDEFRADQLDTFFCDGTGRLVHYWFHAPGPWHGEVLATGGQPGSALGVQVKWAGDGMFHVFMEGASGGQIHRFWNGRNWAGDEQEAP